MQTSLPTTIGPFRVESLLGAGGMGEVYKAVDPTLGRPVAVKIVKSDTHDSQYFKRLLREAQAYGRLKHPNIVTVYEAREAAGGLYIAMEYLDGGSLSGVLTRDQLSLEARITILIQVLDALHYAHAQGIVHRDIKPSNIQILADGTVKLLDFGLARVMRTETLTAADVVLGTPHYASPEQLMGQEIDGRTDVYSTGVLAYEMLTRRRPFEGHSLGTIVAKVLSEPAPPMDTAWSRAYPEIEWIVRHAMAKQVHERYPSAAAMQLDLTAFLAMAQAATSTRRDAVTNIPIPVTPESTVILNPPRAAVAAASESTAPLPQAPEARTVRVVVADAAPPPAPEPEPAHAPAPAAPRTAPRMPSPGAPRPRIPEPSESPARSARTVATWLGAVGAVAGIVILLVVVGGGANGSSGTSGSSGSSRSGGSTSESGGSGGSGGSTRPGGSGEASPVTGPIASNSPRGSVGGRMHSTTRPAVPGGGSRGQAGIESRAVFIDAAGGDAALNRELVNALAEKGVTTVASAARAQLTVAPRIQISLRPAPIGGTSALTADFVATLQMRGRTGNPETRSIDGHALDFGEAVAKQAAYKRAAEQLAEIIDAAMRD